MVTANSIDTRCSVSVSSRDHRRVLFLAAGVLVMMTVATGPSVLVHADKFNYRSTRGDDYGPEDWKKVKCKDLDTCEGWPDKHLSSIGWELEENMCLSCPATGKRDGKCDNTHRMSPIDLQRDRAIQDGKNWKECPDWHWMNFEDGTCTWDDMKNSFEINRHALTMNIPMRDNGDINCRSSEGFRKYPRLDYSKGFPDWWHLDRTEIKVPSEHTQNGKRYAAEVVLSHFYELDHWKNQIGYVSLFMQDYPGQEPWHYLDKLICAWRLEEEEQRKECGLPPAPVYKMCELFRGQTRSFDDFEFFNPEAAGDSSTGGGSTTTETGQLERPDPIPIQDLGTNPDMSQLPGEKLQLCQGDCDFNEDCAPGLMCHRREAFGTIPGCIGGEEDSSTNDYCVFDPFGPGYEAPTPEEPETTEIPDATTTEAPVTAPTEVPVPAITEAPVTTPTEVVVEVEPTEAPTALVTELTPPTEVPTRLDTSNTDTTDGSELKPIKNVGWEPLELLNECEGDCDADADCGPGLVCFNRESSMQAVPGCSGGESDFSLTDYCIQPQQPVLPELGGDDSVISRVDTKAPTESPSVGIVATSSPTETATAATTGAPVDNTTTSTTAPSSSSSADVNGPIPLDPLGWTPEDEKPLGRCQGDCDVDSDCGPGLVCFQRTLPGTDVPGCLGGKENLSLMDFCIRDPTAITVAAPVSTLAPSDPPVAVSFQDASTSAPDSTNSSGVTDTDTDTVTDTIVPVSDTGVPPPIDCNAFNGQLTGITFNGQLTGTQVNMNRFCDPHPDECCQNPRSSSNYCHEMYTYFGNQVDSICHHCCLQVNRQESLPVGPANTPKDGLEPYTECQALDNTARFCRDGGCCDPETSGTEYCQAQLALHGDDAERICWYCCHPSKEFPPPPSGNRQLESGENDNVVHTAMTEKEMKEFYDNDERPLGEGDKFFHDSTGRKLIVRAENFEPKTTVEEDMAKFHEMYDGHVRRELQTSVAENYDDVYWWPYEWLLKVGTEYYFRYEGSMTVPPCYTVNHWRVMKDPIRVATHQIKELERLLAWRLDGKCNADTAGRPRQGNPDAVDVTRPLQKLERGHRMVFCECQDWPSKFPEERKWCRKWQEIDPEVRLFQNPYNWGQAGF
eukprot:CAMPEP_0113452454 /NCGR_PEP_ID=MMETSP0014_2-20120614/6854_1 /TAXON_ID=2857 /ORGANISM="Nitzschia sp." /LENGTH=1126 /DNA_ID=CAMNT_0000343825 /DNA_START=1476 /DNA_END=4856 /DNA_ORIENTATION=- /assembly_acc=CAM_ASM_000159